MANQSCERVLIAEGTLPQPGKDAWIEELVRESETKGRPQENQDGKVDYHSLAAFTTVAAGTPLLRKHPATPGVPGTGVDETVIPYLPGKDVQIRTGTGTTISPADSNLIIASISGQPIYSRESVRVVSNLEVAGVNFETGNIEFDGSVTVRGPVLSGFKITAGGNIVTFDTVEGLELTAGGSIHIHGGIFGKGKTKISARGGITADFFYDCVLECEGDLSVREVVGNCTVICEGLLSLGQNGGKGQIFGGKIIASRGVRSNILGSISEVATQVEVSPSPHLLERQKAIVKELHKLESQYEEANKSLRFHKSQKNHRTDPRIDKLIEASMFLLEKMEPLRAELEDLSSRIQSLPAECRIHAEEVFPRVLLRIGQETKTISSHIKQLDFSHSSAER